MKKINKLLGLGLSIGLIFSQDIDKSIETKNNFNLKNSDKKITLNLYQEKTPTEENKIQKKVDVGIVKEENIRISLRKAVSLVGGFDFIKPTDTVLIKPNVNSDDPYPGTTNPDVLDEVIAMVKEKGAKRIIIADCSGIPWPDTMRNMEKLGFTKIAKKHGVEIISLDNEEWEWIKPKGLKYWSNGFRIPKLLRNVDHIINVAVVKTHSIADFTMSLKNFVGLIHRQDRMIMHSSRYIKEMIGELNLAFKPSINILDATKVFVRGGPAKGEERDVGMIIASPDRIACDITGLSLLKILGTTPQIQNKNMWEHPQIKRAIELNIGVNTPEKINLLGLNIDLEKFKDHLK